MGVSESPIPIKIEEGEEPVVSDSWARKFRRVKRQAGHKSESSLLASPQQRRQTRNKGRKKDGSSQWLLLPSLPKIEEVSDC